MSETLKGKKCNSCGFAMLEPSFCCPSCGSEKLVEMTFNGKGSIYTYTVVHVAAGHLVKRVPYILAVVELQEGLKVLTIVDNLPIDQVAIGKPVVFQGMEEGTGPIFTSVSL
jgi:uncharacterized protein